MKNPLNERYENVLRMLVEGGRDHFTPSTLKNALKTTQAGANTILQRLERDNYLIQHKKGEYMPRPEAFWYIKKAKNGEFT